MLAQPRKRLVWIISLILVLITGALISLYLYLPRYVETRLIPRIVRSFGLDARKVRVKRVSFFGTELGPVHLSTGDRTALAVETLRVEYSLVNLVGKQIRAVFLEGLRISLNIDEHGLTVAGINLPRAARTGQAAPSPPLDLKTLLPLALDHIAIRDAALEMTWQDKQMDIPFEIEADTSALPQGIAAARIQLWPRQSRLDLGARVDSAQNLWSVNLKNLSADLAQFGDFLPRPESIKVKGTLLASGSAQGTLSPAAPEHYSFSAQLTAAAINLGQATLSNTLSDKGPLPIQLTINANTPQSLAWSLAPFEVQANARARVTAMAGTFSFGEHQWAMQAKAATTLPPQSIRFSADQALALKTSVTLPWDLKSASTLRDGLTFSISSRPDPRGQTSGSVLCLALAGNTWTGQAPVIHIQGRQGPDGVFADYRLALPQNTFNLPEGARALAALSAEGRLSAGDRIAGDLRLAATDSTLRMGKKNVKIKNITCGLHAARDKAGNWLLGGQAEVKDARVIAPRLQLVAKQINSRLPFAWPAPAKAKAGSLSIGAIIWKNNSMGTLQGTLRQKNRGVAFDLQHKSKLFKNLLVYLKGVAGSKGATLDVNLPPHTFDKEVDLGAFDPAAENYLVQGLVAARGHMSVQDGHPGGTAWLKIDQGRLRHEKQKLVLSQIQADIKLEDLAHMRSRPGQTLKVGRIQLDQIQARDLDAAFTVASADSLRIEKAGLNWCGGTIRVQDVMLSATNKDVALTLDCKGINMTMMLKQLGVAEGSGEVALNGSIPVRWARGKLSFDKGFLSSPPGQTGIIQLRELKGSQQLLGGLPPDTPQRVQMDIAMEALKDYTYESVDLRLSSDADNLVMKLQLEGKPNQLLPFSYDEDLGQFKRIQGEGQADFKGIGIDLNLRSPFNEIINYKKLFNPKP